MRFQTAVSRIKPVSFVLIGLLLAINLNVVLPQPAMANETNIVSPIVQASSQTIIDGDYIIYNVTVGSDIGIRRFDFSNVNETRMTVDITSTIWYFGSVSFTSNYSYQDNMVVVPGLMGDLSQDSKVGEANISTTYGTKHVNVFSLMDSGPYSEVLRTFLVPIDCLVYYKYYGNDTDGNHVIITLDQTNIGWLQEVGHPLPSSPQNVVAIPGNAHVVLSWNGPIDNGSGALTNYNIYRSTTAGGTFSLIASPEGFTFTDTSLVNGQSYWYEVSAVNTNGEGVLTAPISSTPFTIPGAPTGLVTVAGNMLISLNWTAPAFDGGRAIDYYIVYQDGLDVAHSTTPIAIITSLNNGQEYNFTVRAHNAAGNSTQSNSISAIPVTVPGAPTGVTAIPGPNRVTIAWQAPSSTGGSPITGYIVYRGSQPIANVSATTTEYMDTSGVVGTIYTYNIVASNTIGNSSISAPVSASPQPDNTLLYVSIGIIVIAVVLVTAWIILRKGKK
jgi:hypothetical protein